MDSTRFAATGSAYDRPEPRFEADFVHVGRGTPMGELLRRYWHPVALSAKVADLPVSVRVLGEDLVLFRKPDGTAGLVYPRCVHRGTTLLYGKVTQAGIRCCYHGWTFDTDGKCVEQPCEPNGGIANRGKVRQPWYPVAEKYGMVFAYMGPPDRQPPLPAYDILDDLPDGWELYAHDQSIPSAGAGYLPCNWLQHHENGIDGAHVQIVHADQFPPMISGSAMEFSNERLPDRVLGHGHMRMGAMQMDIFMEMIFPLVRIIPNPMLVGNRPDNRSNNIQWTVPKDDTETIVFTAIIDPPDFRTFGGENRPSYNGKSWHEMTQEEHQRFPGDFEAQIGQGTISFHSEEHLASSDRGIVMYRRMLREALATVRQGGDPVNAFGTEPLHIISRAKAVITNTAPEAEGELEPALPILLASTTLDGKWDLIMKTPLGNQASVLTIAIQGSAVTGTIAGEPGETPLKEGQLAGNVLRFKTDIKKPMSLTVSFTLTIDGDQISGKAKLGMLGSMDVSGRRGQPHG